MRIHDVGIDEKADYFLVMKYVEGETIEDIITRLAAGDPAYHAKYTVAHRVQIFMGILDAITHANRGRPVSPSRSTRVCSRRSRRERPGK